MLVRASVCLATMIIVDRFRTARGIILCSLDTAGSVSPITGGLLHSSECPSQASIRWRSGIFVLCTRMKYLLKILS
ncbi:hypothetical protein D3C80_1052440 [compost metagenome]